MLDNWEDVEDVIRTNGTFVLVIEEVVSQSQLLEAKTFVIALYVL